MNLLSIVHDRFLQKLLITMPFSLFLLEIGPYCLDSCEIFL